MQDERLPKLIMEWILGERRKRRRPRKTWMEGVRAAMKTRHLGGDQWLNRKEWCLGSGRRRQLSQDRKDRYSEMMYSNCKPEGGTRSSETSVETCNITRHLKSEDSILKNHHHKIKLYEKLYHCIKWAINHVV